MGDPRKSPKIRLLKEKVYTKSCLSGAMSKSSVLGVHIKRLIQRGCKDKFLLYKSPL